MDRDLEILRTWLLDNIAIDEAKLEKMSYKEYNSQCARIDTFKEVLSNISAIIDMRKRML